MIHTPLIRNLTQMRMNRYMSQTNQTPLSKQRDTEINLTHKNDFNHLAHDANRSDSYQFSASPISDWRHLNTSEFEYCVSNHNQAHPLQKFREVRNGLMKYPFIDKAFEALQAFLHNLPGDWQRLRQQTINLF